MGVLAMNLGLVNLGLGHILFYETAVSHADALRRSREKGGHRLRRSMPMARRPNPRFLTKKNLYEVSRASYESMFFSRSISSHNTSCSMEYGVQHSQSYRDDDSRNILVPGRGSCSPNESEVAIRRRVLG